MLKTARSCLTVIGGVTVVALLALGAWTQRDWIRGWFEGSVIPLSTAAPTEELARRAEEKLEALGASNPPARVRFDRAELQSYLELRVLPQLPAGVTDPEVLLEDSTLTVRVQLQLDALAETIDVAPLRQLLGDSTSVEAELEPDLASIGEGRVEVHAVRAGAFPVPPLAIPLLLRQVGLPTEGSMSRAVVFPVDSGVRSIAVRDSMLEVTTAE